MSKIEIEILKCMHTHFYNFFIDAPVNHERHDVLILVIARALSYVVARSNYISVSHKTSDDLQ